MYKGILGTFSNQNISDVNTASDTVGTTCCRPIIDNKDRWEVGEKSQGRGFLSQLHCDNGARVLALFLLFTHTRSLTAHTLTHTNGITSFLNAINLAQRGPTEFKQMQRVRKGSLWRWWGDTIQKNTGMHSWGFHQSHSNRVMRLVVLTNERCLCIFDFFLIHIFPDAGL